MSSVQAMVQRLPQNGAPFLSAACDQLLFLFTQLSREDLEEIVYGVEDVSGVGRSEGFEVCEPGGSRDQAGRAVARILYATAGLSFEDRVFALTQAEIQALMRGADDDSYQTIYRQ